MQTAAVGLLVLVAFYSKIAESTSSSSSSTTTEDDDCWNYTRMVLRHNSPELIGHNLENEGVVEFIFTWKHIDSLLHNERCVGFYLLQSRVVVPHHHHHRHPFKRESVSATSTISKPMSTDNTSGSIRLDVDDCRVYEVQLSVASSTTIQTGLLSSSHALRFWPKASFDSEIQVESQTIRILLPRECRDRTRGWTASIQKEGEREETQNDDVTDDVTDDAVDSFPSSVFTELFPCTSYKIRLRDSTGTPVWTHYVSTKASNPNLVVNPGYKQMHVQITPSLCQKSDSIITEITYCSVIEDNDDDDDEEDKEATEGSGEDGSFYYYDGRNDRPTIEEDACVTQTIGSDNGVVLSNLKECTLYSLNAKTVDMNAQTAADTVLEQYGTVHSTLCRKKQRIQKSSSSSTTTTTTIASVSTTTTTVESFWFESTTTDQSQKTNRQNSPVPGIHRKKSDAPGLDITIGISLGLSCLFILIGATLTASVLYFYYNDKMSPRFAKISHYDEDDDDDVHEPEEVTSEYGIANRGGRKTTKEYVVL